MSEEHDLDKIAAFYECEKGEPEYAIAEVATELRNRGHNDLAAKLWDAIDLIESRT